MFMTNLFYCLEIMYNKTNREHPILAYFILIIYSEGKQMKPFDGRTSRVTKSKVEKCI